MNNIKVLKGVYERAFDYFLLKNREKYEDKLIELGNKATEAGLEAVIKEYRKHQGDVKNKLEQLLDVLDAHETVCYNCESTDEEHCDCLKREKKEARKLINSIQ